MPSGIPDPALNKRQAIERISQDHPDVVADVTDFSLEQIYGGEKIDATLLTRTVSKETKLSPDSTEISVKPAEEIDQGVSLSPLDEYADADSGTDASEQVRSYNGVTDAHQIECPDCSGSGRTCTECSGSGTVSCNNCSTGVSGWIRYKCGCRGTEKNRGYRNKAVAKTGDILRTCTSCGGDGYRGETRGSGVKCSSCNGQGAFAETCQNCGGDGIESREQCRRCDGRGEYTCEKCDGAGDVDQCSTCEGDGQATEQQVYEVTYEITTDDHIESGRGELGETHVTKRADEIAWTLRETKTLTDGASELPVSPDQKDDVDIVAAKTEYYEPALYRANVEADHPTLSERPQSVSMLVSDEVIEHDGEFSVSDKGGLYGLGRAFDIALRVAVAAVMNIIPGAVAGFATSVALAFFIDFGVIENPAPGLRVPTPGIAWDSYIFPLMITLIIGFWLLFTAIGALRVLRGQITTRYNISYTDKSG